LSQDEGDAPSQLEVAHVLVLNRAAILGHVLVVDALADAETV
jgi:hypothetical protein